MTRTPLEICRFGVPAVEFEDPEVQKALHQVVATAIKHKALQVELCLDYGFTRATFRLADGLVTFVDISVSPRAFIAKLLVHGQIVESDAQGFKLISKVDFKAIIAECLVEYRKVEPIKIPGEYCDTDDESLMGSVVLSKFNTGSADSPALNQEVASTKQGSSWKWDTNPQFNDGPLSISDDTFGGNQSEVAPVLAKPTPEKAVDKVVALSEPQSSSPVREVPLRGRDALSGRKNADVGSVMDPEGLEVEAAGSSGEERTLLVIDDDPDQRAILRRVFELEGYRVETAADGIDGIVTASKTPPDIIIVDFMMPDLDGRETICRLRKGERTGRIPIVALTAYADSSVEFSLLEAGANDFCSKSVSKKVLLKRIERLVRPTA